MQPFAERPGFLHQPSQAFLVSILVKASVEMVWCASGGGVQVVVVCKWWWCASGGGVQVVVVCKWWWCASGGGVQVVVVD